MRLVFTFTLINFITMKNKGTAYMLWFFGIFGVLGFHQFYLGKVGKGLLYLFTGGILGVGAFIDLFTLGGQVEQYNTKIELNQIRASTNALAANANAYSR
jgi:TM2 domain-containing membrane protein YozV